MGTFQDKDSVDPPLKGMRKILKRYKPKLFRKKLLEECDTMIYAIEDEEDIRFNLDCLKWQPIEEQKTLVVISNVMTWAGKSKKEVVVDMEVDATEQSDAGSVKKEEKEKEEDEEEEEEEEEEEDEEEKTEEKEGEKKEEEKEEESKAKKTVRETSLEPWKEGDYK